MAEQVLEKDRDHLDGIYDDGDGSMDNKYMTFKISEEVFAIDIQFILEIIELQKITDVPDMPLFVKGVINLRGKIIPVIDLRLRFGLEEKEYDDRTCIIVTLINDMPMGFIIDTVDEVVDIIDENISDPPKFKTESGRERYVKGIGKVGEEVKIILDVQKLLYEKDLQVIKKINTDKIVEN